MFCLCQSFFRIIKMSPLIQKESIIIIWVSEFDYNTKFKQFMFLFDKQNLKDAKLDDAMQQMTSIFFNFFKQITYLNKSMIILNSNYWHFLHHEWTTSNFKLVYYLLSSFGVFTVRIGLFPENFMPMPLLSEWLIFCVWVNLPLFQNPCIRTFAMRLIRYLAIVIKSLLNKIGRRQQKIPER